MFYVPSYLWQYTVTQWIMSHRVKNGYFSHILTALLIWNYHMSFLYHKFSFDMCHLSVTWVILCVKFYVWRVNLQQILTAWWSKSFWLSKSMNDSWTSKLVSLWMIASLLCFCEKNVKLIWWTRWFDKTFIHLFEYMRNLAKLISQRVFEKDTEKLSIGTYDH